MNESDLNLPNPSAISISSNYKEKQDNVEQLPELENPSNVNENMDSSENSKSDLGLEDSDDEFIPKVVESTSNQRKVLQSPIYDDLKESRPFPTEIESVKKVETSFVDNQTEHVGENVRLQLKENETLKNLLITKENYERELRNTILKIKEKEEQISKTQNPILQKRFLNSLEIIQKEYNQTLLDLNVVKENLKSYNY